MRTLAPVRGEPQVDGRTVTTRRSLLRHSPRAAATLAILSVCYLAACSSEDAPEIPTSDGSTQGLIARASALELDTEYSPPPGENLHHHTSGFAKILCSAVFITGLDPADAAANVGGFTSPFGERAHVVDTVVDFSAQRVSLTLPDGVTRTAKKYKNQGCVTHAMGEDSVHFTPTDVARKLPRAASTPWPMGDVLSGDPWPEDVDMAKVEEALDGAEGLRLFGENPPDLVLTDINMPGLDGHDVIEAIRVLHADIPIIAISGGGVNMTSSSSRLWLATPCSMTGSVNKSRRESNNWAPVSGARTMYPVMLRTLSISMSWSYASWRRTPSPRVS